jgi:hypothetical protein
VIDEGYAHAEVLISQAFAREGCWQEKVRGALGALLDLFDRDPLCARAWLLETVAAGVWISERHERRILVLTQTLLSACQASKTRSSPSSAAVGRALSEDDQLKPALQAGDRVLLEGLRRARSHRARACILYLAERPAASNREIARAVGITRDDQASSLLTRLQTQGLIVKRRGPAGGANASTLTPRGARVARALVAEEARSA